MPVATTSVDAFLDLLDVSQLVKPALMTKVRDQIPLLGSDANDVEKVAKSLVKSQLLSVYHVARLLSGHADGFYLGKYKLLDVLGQGGMGVVYLAEQITMNRLVALKVIGRISKNKNDSLARFQREARAVAQLSHQNIIQAYDFDQIDGIPFISMEFVEGIDVERQLTKFGRTDWRQAADYAMQAASGLEAARQAKFVHRDIKPGNLLVDTNGIVKILDLGLVVTKEQRRNDSLTTTQDQVGTVDYMAPEQALNSHGVDIRADIYSLGGVLHFMLTGQIPFPGKSSAEKLLQHQSKPATPVRQLGVDVPEEFERLILKMLEKKPADRFQSPLEVAEALKPFAEKKTPPYSASAIKHPKVVFVPLLGRSPDPHEINVKGQLSGVLSPLSDTGPQVSTTATKARSMDSTGVKPIPLLVTNAANKSVPNAIVKREPSQVQQKGLAKTQQGTKPSGPRSTIVVIPNQAEQSEEDMFADLPLLPSAPSPRRIRKSNDKKKGGGKNESGNDSQFLMMVGGGLTAALLIFGLVIFMSGGRPNQTALAVTSPSDDPGTGVSSHDRWKAYSEELRKDPDMVAYYTFSDPKDNGDVLHSQATSPKFGSMNGKVHGGAAWVPGRFSQKRALQFGGKGSGHYVSLGDGDSRNCNFTTPFTIAAWFKTDRFDAAHQVIVAKGDQSWRLQRDTEKNMLHLALNNYAPKNSDSSAPSRHQFAKVEGITPVNDNKWHLAVGVYDFAAARPTITLYLDGQLEGVAKIDLPKETNSAVMIGANSDTFGRNEFRYWRGLIDEVMILNRSMKPAEIEQMYEAGRPVQ